MELQRILGRTNVIGWARTVAWATLALVAFQLVASMVVVDDRATGWSVSTMVQICLAALLAVGAYQRRTLAIILLGLLGLLRLVMASSTVMGLIQSTEYAIPVRVLIELAVALPVATIWILGMIAVLRSVLADGSMRSL